MYKINTAAKITFGLISTTDGSALTGATVTVYRSLDGGTQATASGSVTELGHGQYVFNATSGDMNCTGSVGFLFTASGAVAVSLTIAPDSKLVSDLHDIAAGAQMDLVDAPNSTAITAMNSGLATSTNITNLQTHGDSTWATATGFALAGSSPSWYTAPDNSDIATLIISVGSALGTHVSSILTIVGTSGVVVGASSVTSIQSGLATSTNISDLQTHGDNTWATATGFALASAWTSGLATALGKLTFDGSNNVHSTPQTAVTVGTNSDKTGYTLASNGLDALDQTEPEGDVSGWTWPQKLLALFARAFNKNTFPDSGNGSWTTFQRDGTSTLASQTVTDDSTTQTLGSA